MTTHAAARTQPRSRDMRALRRLLRDPDIRVFLPSNAHEGGVFRARKGSPDLLDRITAQHIDALVDEGALGAARRTKTGRTFHAVPVGQRTPRARTARDQRSASWLAAERVFASGTDGKSETIRVNLGESPIGWLAKRRDPNGKPFLSRDEVAAGERLRVDFERAQLGPNVTQDWKRFLTAGVEGGRSVSAQDRNIDGGADAARRRMAEALDALGPGLSDVALRVCCFLEGIGSVESEMHWSARSGKVVLKIALQRLAAFYDQKSLRKNAGIEAWMATEPDR